MSKLVIIGQSPAAYSAIKTLRASGAAWDITLIPTDGHLPYDRDLLPGLIARSVKDKDVFCAPEDFYKDNNIEIIRDKELSRINFNRHKVYLADRLQVDYDVLLITDAPQVRFPEIKGLRRQGVFHITRLDSARRIGKHLIFVETAVVVPHSLRGILTALALKAAGKEVVLVFAQDKPFPEDVEASATLLKLMDKSALRVILNNPIEDILGEGEAQAVRLKSGKVMACEMVIVEEVVPDLRFLADSGLLMQERICVHTTMKTNMADVYAVDAVMELVEPKVIGSYDGDTANALSQGECAASAVLGREEHFQYKAPNLMKGFESVFPIEALSPEV
ncbi:MAG: FAD-dependent oxidoreductase [Candidatus Omnitrophica bacterium]|nr:FAD-dependent oxidoreductase [Candidatus Omnitrophota bacterium]